MLFSMDWLWIGYSFRAGQEFSCTDGQWNVSSASHSHLWRYSSNVYGLAWSMVRSRLEIAIVSRSEMQSDGVRKVRQAKEIGDCILRQPNAASACYHRAVALGIPVEALIEVKPCSH